MDCLSATVSMTWEPIDAANGFERYGKKIMMDGVLTRSQGQRREGDSGAGGARSPSAPYLSREAQQEEGQLLLSPSSGPVHAEHVRGHLFSPRGVVW